MKNGKEYVGSIVAVANAPELRSGKALLNVTVREQSSGELVKGTLWLNKDDAKGDFPSSFDKTKALFAYLGCTAFAPPFNGVNPEKVVTFTYDEQPTGKVDTNGRATHYKSAKFIAPPPGVIVRNAMSAAEQLELFGSSAAQKATQPRDFNPDAEPSGGDDIPFDFPQ
jgi:hypothetical protein